MMREGEVRVIRAFLTAGSQPLAGLDPPRIGLALRKTLVMTPRKPWERSLPT